MRIKATLIAATILASPVMVAQAAEWVMFAASPTESHFLDPSSVVKTGDHYRVETYVNELQGQNQSAQVQYEVDCRDRRARALRHTIHAMPDLEGPVIVDDQVRGKWLAAPAGSLVDALVKRVCQPGE